MSDFAVAPRLLSAALSIAPLALLSACGGRGMDIDQPVYATWTPSPFPRIYAYLVTGSADGILGLQLESNGSSYRSIQSKVTGSAFSNIVADPKKRFLWAATDNGSTSTLRSFRINSDGGALAEGINSPVITLTNPVSLLPDPTGQFVFAGTDHSVNVYAVNASNGTLSFVSGSSYYLGPIPTAVDLAFDSVSASLFIQTLASNNASVEQASFNSSTGLLTQVVSRSYGANPNTPINLAWDAASSHLYALSGPNANPGGEAYCFSLASGVLQTPVGTTALSATRKAQRVSVRPGVAGAFITELQSGGSMGAESVYNCSGSSFEPGTANLFLNTSFTPTNVFFDPTGTYGLRTRTDAVVEPIRATDSASIPMDVSSAGFGVPNAGKKGVIVRFE